MEPIEKLGVKELCKKGTASAGPIKRLKRKRGLQPLGKHPPNPAVHVASSTAFEFTLFQGTEFFNRFLTPLFSRQSDPKVLKTKNLTAQASRKSLKTSNFET